MAEYYLGKEQTFDGEWIDYLTQNFDDASSSQKPGESSKAFRKVVKQLVLSNTFSTRDPEAKKCYDFAPDHQPTDLPCEIAFNIQNNCAVCHSGGSAASGLNLTKWINNTELNEANFMHTDSNGKQIAKTVTMTRIISRLSTNDENVSMPFRRFMKPNDRAQLFEWANQQTR